MTLPAFDPTRDLSIGRIIRAPRAAVWAAWTDPASFAQWWLPAPTRCEIVAFDPRPGGALHTRMSEDGGPFVPHMDACFLEVVECERIVFTDTLSAGWRPAAGGFMSAVISFADHPDGTDYRAHVLHKDAPDRQTHIDYGFDDGWGTVIEQLAALVEKRIS